jgi:hypothetical protein
MIFNNSDDDDGGNDEDGSNELSVSIENKTWTFPDSDSESSASSSSSDDGWFNTYTISIDTDEKTTSPSPDPAPSQPQPKPEGGDYSGPSATGYDRGTFVFPNDEHFMQTLEARGLNGAHERVETVYVLTGDSYTTPTSLFRLDNPEYYSSATRRSVTSYGGKMAKKVAALYPDGETPNMVARFHTHPGGSTRPSDTDKDSATEIEKTFRKAFDTSDFEFFQGIHAYKDHNDNPNPGARQNPSEHSNGVSWKGEQYRHELALFDSSFKNPRKVVLDNDR